MQNILSELDHIMMIIDIQSENDQYDIEKNISSDLESLQKIINEIKTKIAKYDNIVPHITNIGNDNTNESEEISEDTIISRMRDRILYRRMFPIYWELNNRLQCINDIEELNNIYHDTCKAT